MSLPRVRYSNHDHSTERSSSLTASAGTGGRWASRMMRRVAVSLSLRGEWPRSPGRTTPFVKWCTFCMYMRPSGSHVLWQNGRVEGLAAVQSPKLFQRVDEWGQAWESSAIFPEAVVGQAMSRTRSKSVVVQSARPATQEQAYMSQDCPSVCKCICNGMLAFELH